MGPVRISGYIAHGVSVMRRMVGMAGNLAGRNEAHGGNQESHLFQRHGRNFGFHNYERDPGFPSGVVVWLGLSRAAFSVPVCDFPFLYEVGNAVEFITPEDASPLLLQPTGEPLDPRTIVLL